MERTNEKNNIGSLEHAREALYSPRATEKGRLELSPQEEHTVQHSWGEKILPVVTQVGEKHVRIASIFFAAATTFFLLALIVTSYFFYFGSNSVGVEKITVDVLGPTAISGGDTVTFSITIKNKNPVAIENAIIEIDFPEGTRSTTDLQSPYPRYVESLDTLASGATVTRTVKAVLFGGAGQTIKLPIIFSYGTASSNAIFEKKSSYDLAISSTPLSVAVDAMTEVVSGAPITFSVTVRSNTTIPLSNVVLSLVSPFGFTVTSSSVPQTNSSFSIGTLAPGASKQINITGTLTGQNAEQRVFHFTVGTAKSPKDQSLAVEYMTQDATVTIASPFITTTIALNGSTSNNTVLSPGSVQNVSLRYTNSLNTIITNASVAVTISGSAVDYDSIKTTSGFYNSSDHSIIFSRDTDPALALLSPGASGIGSFTFSTLPVGTQSPNVSLAVSVSGTRVGQTNVPEQVTTSIVRSAKVATVVSLETFSSRSAGGVTNSGPIPPRSNQATTYSVVWNVANKGSAVADGVVTTTLPGYISYTGVTSGSGSFSYDKVSRTLTWKAGDIVQGGSAQGVFQVSLTPSTSQKGGVVELTNRTAFKGYDRFAGLQISAASDPVTTETKTDVGYVPANSIVQ